MSIYFSSDLHIGHANILKYCNRPFQSVNEMNEGLVKNWNETVNKNDVVYVLGDVCMGRLEDSIAYLRRLNGQKFLIIGNHDRHNLKNHAFTEQFGWCRDMYELKVQDKEAKMGHQRIVLCHYALRTWNHMRHGALHCYGHSHSELENIPYGKSMDVGVDNVFKLKGTYRPIAYEEVKILLSSHEVLGHHDV